MYKDSVAIEDASSWNHFFPYLAEFQNRKKKEKLMSLFYDCLSPKGTLELFQNPDGYNPLYF